MLSPDTVLYRIPDLTIRIDTTNSVRLNFEGRVLKLGPESLSILDVVHTPCSVAEVLRRCNTRLAGRRSTEQTLRALATLVDTGVLRVDPDREFNNTPTPNYDSSFIHQTILNDITRKTAFIQGVREIVGPDDVVLDLGTGSGILALAAARAGARRVYAVEPASMVHLAEEVAVHNCLADRIEFIRSWSTNLQLPERATVLTTDIVGNEALDMVIWESIQDARTRLLQPNARILPNSLHGLATLVQLPAEVIAKHRIDQQQIDAWNSVYGVDFSPLREAQRNRPVGFYERPEIVRDWKPLGDADSLYELDLREPTRSLDEIRTLTATRSGLANGVVVYFDARLSPSHSFCSSPWQAGPDSHWFTAVWILPEPVVVRPSSTVRIRFRYFGEGQTKLEPANAGVHEKEFSR